MGSTDLIFSSPAKDIDRVAPRLLVRSHQYDISRVESIKNLLANGSCFSLNPIVYGYMR